eukprot:15993-Eustigmatos_ZCMA.PRE.1
MTNERPAADSDIVPLFQLKDEENTGDEYAPQGFLIQGKNKQLVQTILDNFNSFSLRAREVPYPLRRSVEAAVGERR